MTLTSSSRSAAFLAAIALATLAFTSQAARAEAASRIGWYRVDRQCADLSPETVTVSCGARGTFVLGPWDLANSTSCPSRGFGAEVPPAWSGRTSSAATVVRTADGRPWVAVLDHADARGLRHARQVERSSDRRVAARLFDLGAAGSTDLEVLRQLCAVAEAALEGDRPVAVSLGVGRPASATDEAAVCGLAGPGSLGCEIRGVLSHLRLDLGIPVIAPAGDETGFDTGALLFPADDDNVLGAGGLDRDYFVRPGGDVVPAPGTSLDAEALVPAPGAGAVALFSGWLAGSLVREPGTSIEAGGTWLPWLEGGAWRLYRRGELLAGSDLSYPTEFVASVLRAGATKAALVPEEGDTPQDFVVPCRSCHGDDEDQDIEDP